MDFAAGKDKRPNLHMQAALLRRWSPPSQQTSPWADRGESCRGPRRNPWYSASRPASITTNGLWAKASERATKECEKGLIAPSESAAGTARQRSAQSRLKHEPMFG